MPVKLDSIRGAAMAAGRSWFGDGTSTGRLVPERGWRPPTQSAVQITALESTACMLPYPHFSPVGGIHSVRPA